jgi:hypothetical protein
MIVYNVTPVRVMVHLLMASQSEDADSFRTSETRLVTSNPTYVETLADLLVATCEDLPPRLQAHCTAFPPKSARVQSQHQHSTYLLVGECACMHALGNIWRQDTRC